MNKDPLIGTIVNEKYKVEALVGEGGMGKVFRATHLELNKPFALKLMQFDIATSSAKNISRFKREASTLAKLNHPNIVSITDFGVLDKRQLPYIIMEYVEGVTLRKLLKLKETLTESQAINIVKQLCLALHEAHSQGVIHRDLKPENIIIRELEGNEFFVRIVDFGIAKLMKGDSDPNHDSSEGSPGTLRYCSPEQFFKQPVDGRADIFSLCLIFYEMLTNEVPTVMLGDFKPLTEMRPGATPKLDEVIKKGLAQKSSERIESAIALKKELDAIEQASLIQDLKDQVKPKPLVIVQKVTNPLDTNLKTEPQLNKINSKSRKQIYILALIALLLFTTTFALYKLSQGPAQSSQTDILLPKMVKVKGEAFFMGSDDGDEYSKPSHKVSIKSFEVSTDLVTNKEYADFVKSAFNSPPAHWKNDSPTKEIAEKPVTNVSWNEAQSYCKWLSSKTGQKYRLPLETEWEFIARNNSNLNIKNIAVDYFEWTNSEFSLYQGSQVTLPEELRNTVTIILRGKDEKAGKDPVTDRLWQVKSYTEDKLSFRLVKEIAN